ncbi:hypothetical protein QEN19_001430 [Hanseniaspora menglaensis]
MSSTTPLLSGSEYASVSAFRGTDSITAHGTDDGSIEALLKSEDDFSFSEEGMFRSEQMSLIEICTPQEQAKELCYQLGNFGKLQFIPKTVKPGENNAAKLQFTDEIRAMDNLLRQYDFFKELLKEYNIQVISDSNDSYMFDSFYIPKASEIETFVGSANDYEAKFIDIQSSLDVLKTRYSTLLEEKLAIENLSILFKTDLTEHDDNEVTGMTITDRATTSKSKNFITGTVPRSKMAVLEKLCWRLTRGNLYLTNLEITEKKLPSGSNNELVDKNCFVLFVYGEVILQKCMKVIESLDGNIVNLPVSYINQQSLCQTLTQDLKEITQLINTSTAMIQQDLDLISMELNSWKSTITKEYQVYKALQGWSMNQSTATTQAWIPSSVLHEISKDQHTIITVLDFDKKTPPTYHRTNKFTQAFQDICDCYGIAKYREINAGLPTIVTFPFMFAIMFGDLGHGILLFLVAILLVLNEKKIGRMNRDEIFDMAFSGRYILLLMGLFSCFTGFIYNDVFSKTLTLFKSGWSWENGIALSTGTTYAAGLDYNWHGTENGLLFSNSLKMKLSILMGFIHMTYSFMFSLINYINEKSMIDIVGNFIPGLVFMQAIFGYLSICIVYKWSVDWVKDNKPAPGLLNMLINMFLSPGNIEAELYPHQSKVQIILLLLALICVPCLLLIKPIHFKITHKEVENSLENPHSNEEEKEEGGHGETFGDVFIHQVIHTIEFCLNCVSHTASYLRLWALSLAHAQLSEVLWTMTLNIGLQAGKQGTSIAAVFMLFLLFGMWFVLTVLVLVVMEGTSAMLHSLRLHWVESMSKFFVGEGLPYEPFTFN